MSYDIFKNCISECCDCAVTCAQCATACIEEKNNQNLVRCIKLDIECKSMCLKAIDAMASNSEFTGKICELCAEICDACAEECSKFSHIAHCRRCADSCHTCADECRNIVHVAA